MLTSIKKNIKFVLILIILLMMIFTTVSKAVVTPTSEFYVNDYAGLLSEDTKNYIININQKLYKETGAQIVVVTVPSLEGDSLEEYATKLFREFGIGDKQKNNGLLLLLALEERKFRVEVGYGLEGALPDAKTGRIQDEYIIPYLKEDNWNEGIRNGFNAFLDEVTKEYNIEIDKESPVKVGDSINSDGIRYSRILYISFFVGCVIRSIYSKNKNKGVAIILAVITAVAYASVVGLISYLISESSSTFGGGFIFGLRRMFARILNF